MARKFYYDTGEKKAGPVSGDELLQLRDRGIIDSDTWVREGKSPTWRKITAIDLRKEEEEAANPSLWRIFTKHLSWSSIILLVAVLAVIAVLVVGFFWIAWPFFLLVFVLWIIKRISK